MELETRDPQGVTKITNVIDEFSYRAGGAGDCRRLTKVSPDQLPNFYYFSYFSHQYGPIVSDRIK